MMDLMIISILLLLFWVLSLLGSNRKLKLEIEELRNSMSYWDIWRIRELEQQNEDLSIALDEIQDILDEFK